MASSEQVPPTPASPQQASAPEDDDLAYLNKIISRSSIADKQLIPSPSQPGPHDHEQPTPSQSKDPKQEQTAQPVTPASKSTSAPSSTDRSTNVNGSEMGIIRNGTRNGKGFVVETPGGGDGAVGGRRKIDLSALSPADRKAMEPFLSLLSTADTSDGDSDWDADLDDMGIPSSIEHGDLGGLEGGPGSLSHTSELHHIAELLEHMNNAAGAAEGLEGKLDQLLQTLDGIIEDMEGREEEVAGDNCPEDHEEIDQEAVAQDELRVEVAVEAVEVREVEVIERPVSNSAGPAAESTNER